MKTIPKLISKTKILRGYQCAKLFYLSIHHKELEPAITAELQALFDQGHAVGEFAKKHYSAKYSEAVIVENTPWDFIGALKKTKELLNLKTKVIFEAAFEYKGCFARIDMMIYNNETERWQIAEVKSTIKVKDEHLDDIGLQTWIIANAGLPIEKISLVHINPLCVYPDLQNFFTQVDVTDQLRERHPQISVQLNQIFSKLKSDTVPHVDIGRHCQKPNPCAFFDRCFSEKNIPQSSIFNLPTLNEKKWDLYDQRLIDIFDPRLLEADCLTEKQKIFLDVQKTKKRFINQTEIQKIMTTWTFPLIFLDFETISFAIPQYKGTRAFQQVPFQFSVHVLNSMEDTTTLHFEFLNEQNTDPREELVRELLRVFRQLSQSNPQTSPIVAYYAKFEAGVLQDLADYFPSFASELIELKDRLRDPLPIFREHVYDHRFNDSFSLKSVAPALLGDSASYSSLKISDGGAAQRSYLKMIRLSSDSEEYGQIRQNLLQYCEKDTAVLVDLVRWLYKTISFKPELK